MTCMVGAPDMFVCKTNEAKQQLRRKLRAQKIDGLTAVAAKEGREPTRALRVRRPGRFEAGFKNIDASLWIELHEHR